MDGPLDFPVAEAPAPGEVITIAPGVLWLRMRLPFALNHINLWLLEDGAAWTAVDTGFTLPETQRGVAAHFRRPSGRPTNPAGHRDPFPPRSYRHGRLADRALAGAAVDHRQGMAARAHERDQRRGRRVAAPRLRPQGRARRGGQRDFRRAPGQLPTRRAVRAAVLSPHRRGRGHRDRRAALAGADRRRARAGARLPVLRGDRRPDRRRPDPAADFAEYQCADLRAGRRPARPLSRLAEEIARATAARNPRIAVAQSIVPRRPPAHSRIGGTP